MTVNFVLRLIKYIKFVKLREYRIFYAEKNNVHLLIIQY